MKKIKMDFLMSVLFFLIISGITFNPSISSAEMTVDSYCQLTIESMQQDISNYQELIALVNQYSNDPETLAQQEEIKRTEFDEDRDTLYSSYGTTADEYVLYMGKNGKAVNEYLEANTDVKQQIDDLSAQVNSLMEEYETLKEGVINPEPPLP
ncbi:MAG TPA: hypothetical protein ENH01_01550 [Nitrospirae bacterium]|nr:hypothetical protein [Nitrospirota bacterium]